MTISQAIVKISVLKNDIIEDTFEMESIIDLLSMPKYEDNKILTDRYNFLKEKVCRNKRELIYLRGQIQDINEMNNIAEFNG